MAISIVGGATVLVTSANQATYTASSDYTVIGGADNVLVVLGAIEQDSDTADGDVTVTAEGVSMTPAARLSHDGNAGDPYCGIWYLVNPSAGATTIVASVGGGLIGRGAILRCVELDGADAADPLGTIVARQGANNTTIDTTIVPEASGNIVLAIMGAQGGASPFAVTGSASEIVDTESGTNATGDIAAWVGSYATVGTSSVDVGADGDTSGTGNFIAVEFRADSANAYTIAADAGSFTITGTAASLEHGYEVAAGAGAYALTGQSASLEYGRELAAAAGSFAVTGQAASLEFGREVAAGAGSYAVTGAPATLVYGTFLDAEAGAYAVTGAAAGLEFGYALDAEAGAYAVTGDDVSLEFGGMLSAEAGAYAITGADATLIYEPAGAYVIGADAAAFTLSGGDVGLEMAWLLSAESASFGFDGSDAALDYAGRDEEVRTTGGGGGDPAFRRRWTRARWKQWEEDEKRRLREMLDLADEPEGALDEVVEAIEVPPAAPKAAVERIMNAVVPQASLREIADAVVRAYAQAARVERGKRIIQERARQAHHARRLARDDDDLMTIIRLRPDWN